MGSAHCHRQDKRVAPLSVRSAAVISARCLYGVTQPFGAYVTSLVKRERGPVESTHEDAEALERLQTATSDDLTSLKLNLPEDTVPRRHAFTMGHHRGRHGRQTMHRRRRGRRR